MQKRIAKELADAGLLQVSVCVRVCVHVDVCVHVCVRVCTGVSVSSRVGYFQLLLVH